jgi:hypothetical protein
MNLVGQRFGKWIVLSLGTVSYNRKKWNCVCDCGTIKEVQHGHLRSGASKCCGCVGNKKTTERNYKHGMAGTRFHRIWKQMRGRCFTKTNRAYNSYGGRGINICDKWLEFDGFKEDMYEDYLLHLSDFGKVQTSIDRIDVNGGYCKENCRWATVREQNLNTTRTKRYEYAGKNLTVTEWAEELGINYRIIYARLKHGKMPLDKVFSSNKYNRHYQII